MKHILLTSDLSAEARWALPKAVELAKALGAHVTLLNVVLALSSTQGGGMLTAPPKLQDTDAERTRGMEKLKELAGSFPNGVETAQEVIISDDVPRAICQFAKRNDVDLIVMSSHGRSGLRRMLLGSVAEGVMRASAVPVLCVPPAE